MKVNDTLKKILILNGSHSEIPLILSAKKLNLFTITTGNDPKMLGHNLSDKYINCDFSKKRSILEISKMLNIDYICSSANDFGIITASYVSENLELPGHDSYENTLRLHQKDKFKKIAMDLSLYVPSSISFSISDKIEGIESKFDYPFLVKPVDLTGGKGISKVNSKNDIERAIKKAFTISREKRIIIEEFIDGTLHSFSTFLINQKVCFFYSDDEFSTYDPFHVTASFSKKIDNSLVTNGLIDQVQKIAKSLKLVDGVFHLQYIYSDHKFYIIDITRRCSGDFYPLPIKYSCNTDLSSFILRAEMGKKLFSFPRYNQLEGYGRYCIISRQHGRLREIKFNSTLREMILEKFYVVKKGSVVQKNEKVMVIILNFKNFDSSFLLKIENFIQIIVE